MRNPTLDILLAALAMVAVGLIILFLLNHIP